MSVGFIGGKFLPLHLGHVHAIVQAASNVDELYVILSHSEKRDRELCVDTKMEYVPASIRIGWLAELTKDMPHVQVLSVEDDQGNDDYDWKEGARLIKEAIGKPIDYVFSSETDYSAIFEENYPGAKHYLIDPSRSHVTISATAIRTEGVHHHWSYLPDVVKPYFEE
ncbi:adenylyltransferase/cytidyltransferase family protein [Neobacillus niacini]|uniref:adenylyltransferase/cytidyltransferase family protein n=1 Tax=Neobacillus niacini TaxID=86668 RepID=UPI00398356E1